LIEFLPLLVPVSVSALIGTFSLYLYLPTRKNGFVLIGIGFLTTVIPSLIRLALGGPYLPLLLRDRGLSVTEIARFLFVLSLIDVAITIVFAAMVLVGLALFVKDFGVRK